MRTLWDICPDEGYAGTLKVPGRKICYSQINNGSYKEKSKLPKGRTNLF